jgi:hypothetical protein
MGCPAHRRVLAVLLLMVLASGVTYGIMEALYIPTDTMKVATIPGTFGHVAYYHLCLLSFMLIASFGATATAEWQGGHRKKYLLLMSVAGFFLSLMVEDITWFLTRWQPIHSNEWTITPSGWAINLGFTYLPLWYIGTTLLSISLLMLASHFANLGYKKFLTRRGVPASIE